MRLLVVVVVVVVVSCCGCGCGCWLCWWFGCGCGCGCWLLMSSIPRCPPLIVGCGWWGCELLWLWLMRLLVIVVVVVGCLWATAFQDAPLLEAARPSLSCYCCWLVFNVVVAFDCWLWLLWLLVVVVVGCLWAAAFQDAPLLEAARPSDAVLQRYRTDGRHQLASSSNHFGAYLTCTMLLTWICICCICTCK